jgi:hypothetical protein
MTRNPEQGRSVRQHKSGGDTWGDVTKVPHDFSTSQSNAPSSPLPDTGERKSGTFDAVAFRVAEEREAELVAMLQRLLAYPSVRNAIGDEFLADVDALLTKIGGEA